jgi:hypothetical protein
LLSRWPFFFSSSSSSLTGKYVHKEIEGDLYMDREA